MIAGCMRIYKGSLPYLKWTLEPFVDLCDKCYLLLHDVLPRELHIGFPHGTILRDYYGPWNHGDQLDEVFHMTDEDKPDWVFIVDSDEIIPWRTAFDTIDEADAQGKKAASFSYQVPWNGFDKRVKKKLIPTGDHVKAVKWSPDITFKDQAGFCVPKGYWDKVLYTPPYSEILHLYALTEEIRQKRIETHRHDSFFLLPELEDAPKEWKVYEK
jgi:hypothetical protein